jgi:hypothetical protein
MEEIRARLHPIVAFGSGPISDLTTIGASQKNSAPPITASFSIGF